MLDTIAALCAIAAMVCYRRSRLGLTASQILPSYHPPASAGC